jgi:hypothetical protein
LALYVKGRSLIFYMLLTLMNSFLYFSIIDSFGLFAIIHVLIFWLSFNRLLGSKNFDSTLNPNLFSFIPCLTQNIILFIYFLFDKSSFLELISDLYGSWIGVILTIVTGAEFFILRQNYIKFHRART